MLKINETYSIDSEQDCVTIYKSRVVMDKKSKNYGKMVTKPIKYFPTLETAYMALVDMGIQDEGLYRFADIIDRIDALKKDIKATLALES